MREGTASGVCCSVRNYKHSAPSQCTSSSKRRHDRDRYGSHIVSRIAKLLFCFFGYIFNKVWLGETRGLMIESEASDVMEKLFHEAFPLRTI